MAANATVDTTCFASTTTVALNPNDTRAFLLEKTNWLKIVPHTDEGTIHENNDEWTLHTIKEAGHSYTFSNTKSSSDEDTGLLKMEYTCNVKVPVFMFTEISVSIDIKYI
jgi:hypothetical protein